MPPALTGCACRMERICAPSTHVCTPVSSSTSRRTASKRSSPRSMSPVGTFHTPCLAAGPVRSRTTSTSPRPFITKAPTPIWCAGPGGSVDGVSGSQRTSVSVSSSAWWYLKPLDTAAGTSSLCSSGTCSQTPRFPCSLHRSHDWRSASPNCAALMSASAGCSMITPWYVSALKPSVGCAAGEAAETCAVALAHDNPKAAPAMPTRAIARSPAIVRGRRKNIANA
mmetsp:Transcript_257/g.853  ORF Transcript_257/g.853 Transcript_257/m.853 type:complete len:225 (+) Transcript_257:811-1485(+)